MYAGAEPPRHQRRMALDRGNLATPPGLDYREGKTTNQCVNRFQDFFLSELVMHYSCTLSAENETPVPSEFPVNRLCHGLCSHDPFRSGFYWYSKGVAFLKQTLRRFKKIKLAIPDIFSFPEI